MSNYSNKANTAKQGLSQKFAKGREKTVSGEVLSGIQGRSTGNEAAESKNDIIKSVGRGGSKNYKT